MREQKSENIHRVRTEIEKKSLNVRIVGWVIVGFKPYYTAHDLCRKCIAVCYFLHLDRIHISSTGKRIGGSQFAGTASLDCTIICSKGQPKVIVIRKSLFVMAYTYCKMVDCVRGVCYYALSGAIS